MDTTSQQQFIADYLIKAQADMARRAEVITSVCRKWDATDHPMFNPWSRLLRSGTVTFADGKMFCGWQGDEVVPDKYGSRSFPDRAAMRRNAAAAASLQEAKSDRDIAKATRAVLCDWFDEVASKERADAAAKIRAGKEQIARVHRELDRLELVQQGNTDDFTMLTPVARKAARLRGK